MAGAQSNKGQGSKAPEQFSINANATGEAGALASTFVIAIDRYNTDAERDVLATALKQGGYPAFLPALRKSPVVGHITAGKEQFDHPIRLSEAVGVDRHEERPNDRGRDRQTCVLRGRRQG